MSFIISTVGLFFFLSFVLPFFVVVVFKGLVIVVYFPVQILFL